VRVRIPTARPRATSGRTAERDAMARDDDDDDDDRRWYARLVPIVDESARVKHVDRAALTKTADGCARARDAATATARDGALRLRTRSAVLGRIVMNKEGTARAKTQPADLALDVASGAREARARRERGRASDAFEIWIQTRARTRGEGFGRERAGDRWRGRTIERSRESNARGTDGRARVVESKS